MAVSNLASALIGGQTASPLMGDPAMMAAMPDIQLGQGLEQQGISTAPAYPTQALARLAQTLAGQSLVKGGLSDLANAYGNSADSMAKIFPPGTPIGDALRSPNPMIRMMALQQAPKAMLLQSEGYSLGDAQQRYVGANKVAENTNPQSPEGKRVRDAVNLQQSGNPAGAQAVQRGITKETSTNEGVQFPPTNVQPTPDQMAAARQRLAQGLGAVQNSGVTNTQPTGVAAEGETIRNQVPAGPQSMPQAIAGAKATQSAAEKLYGGASEAVGKQIGDVIEAGGKNARDRINALNTIDDALTQGGSGVVTGPFAEHVLRTKQALDAMGIDTSWVKQGLPMSEVISKMNAQLASASAKAMTGRPTQFEFSAWMKNNPGLLTSKEGTHALIDVLRQSAQQDIGLGQQAMNKGNWDKWGDIVDKYYKDHPLRSPFTKQPLGQEAAAPPAAEAPPTIINRQTGERRQLVNGQWQTIK